MTNMKLHPTTVLGLQPTEELGRQLMALRYDLLAPVLEGMLKESRRQSAADEELGNVKLAFRLNELGDGIENAMTALDEVTVICQSFIDAEKAHMTVTFRRVMYVERIGEQIQFTHDGKDYIATAIQPGYVAGANINEYGKASLVYR